MKAEEFVLLLTGTVSPNENVIKLSLKSSTDRLAQYRESILWFLQNTSVTRIVFCENSGSLKELYDDISDKAKSLEKKFEYITFEGNRKLIVEQGKGYGEGEIIEYALKHSSLLQECSYFMKLTGRLKIRNINNIIKRMKYSHFYINAYQNNKVDTRIYAVSRELYECEFKEDYEKVNDRKGYYIEHVFFDTIKEKNLLSSNFPLFPQLIGESGSSGRKYIYNPIKSIKQDVLSCFNYYGTRRFIKRK